MEVLNRLRLRKKGKYMKFNEYYYFVFFLVMFFNYSGLFSAKWSTKFIVGLVFRVALFTGVTAFYLTHKA